jgi:hypothetical protein
MAKKGVYRKLKRVEVLKDTSVYKAGDIREMHPALAKRLIADDLAKASTKELSNPVVLPSAKIKTE